jgi:DNA replication protein DnaC
LNRKTLACIRSARFRYQAIIEEIQYLPQRGLDKNLLSRLADTSFIKRGENVFITGATGCGKSFIASALGYQAYQIGIKSDRRSGWVFFNAQITSKTAIRQSGRFDYQRTR